MAKIYKGQWQDKDGNILFPQTTIDQLKKADGATNADVLDSTGDGSNLTATFTQASSRANINTGEKLSVIFGKIKKWFADLKTVAFSGAYGDLSGRPSIIANLTSTVAGSALDATMGKNLQDQITATNNNLNTKAVAYGPGLRYRMVADGSDFNHIQESGYYRINQVSKLAHNDGLEGLGDWCPMEVITGGGDTAVQIIWSYGEPGVHWVRGGYNLQGPTNLNSGTWTNWVKKNSLSEADLTAKYNEGYQAGLAASKKTIKYPSHFYFWYGNNPASTVDLVLSGSGNTYTLSVNRDTLQSEGKNATGYNETISTQSI